MIDWNKVIQLRDEIGDEDFDEVIDLFLDEVEDVITHVGQPGRNLEHDLHFLKGSALNLGFTDFSDLCQQGESASSQGMADTVDTGEVIASYHTSKQEFLAGLKVKLAS